MNSEDKILIVDDQPSVRFGLRSLLEGEGYRALEAETGEQAISLITEQSPQLVLLDLKLPDADGLMLLPRIKAIDDEAPVVILTAHGTIETAIQALKAGAENFLTKPFDADSLLILIGRVLEQSRAPPAQADRAGARAGRGGALPRSKRTNQTHSRHGRETGGFRHDSLVAGRDRNRQGDGRQPDSSVERAARKAFRRDQLRGAEQGTARIGALRHAEGRVHRRVASKAGLFELAHQGTIFFDEIAEMEPAIQARLLSVLEQKRFRRVGGVQEKEVAVRIIAATNRNLQNEVKRGRFREDLFYRLNVMPIALPPLRECREDIPPLVAHFIGRFNQRLNRRVEGVTPKADGLCPATSASCATSSNAR